MAGYIGTQAVSLNTTSATISDDLAVGDDATIAGTLGVTGVVTANAGVVVDEMTLDADTLTATDTFTIDAVGDITLDTAGADIRLTLAGTAYGKINLASNNVSIQNLISDGDILFKGNDGGSGITALQLDMSAGGRAHFANATSNQMAIFTNTAENSIVQISAEAANKNSILRFGDNDDADVGAIDYDHNINDMIIYANASEGARFISEGGITFNGDTAAANALNDYEEGTWTPSFVAITNPSYVKQVGYYTKVGRKVTFHMNLQWNGGTSIGQNIAGLPYAVANVDEYYFMSPTYNDAGITYPSGRTTFIGYPVKAQSYIQIATTGSNIAPEAPGIATSGAIYITGFYYIN